MSNCPGPWRCQEPTEFHSWTRNRFLVKVLEYDVGSASWKPIHHVVGANSAAASMLGSFPGDGSRGFRIMDGMGQTTPCH